MNLSMTEFLVILGALANIGVTVGGIVSLMLRYEGRITRAETRLGFLMIKCGMTTETEI